MDLLRHTFAGVLLQDIFQPDNYTSCVIVRLAYRLMKQMVVGNANNRKWLSAPRNIEFIVRQVEFPEATATLMELYVDNRSLLKSVTEEDISFFLTHMLQKGRVSSFANFLSILCVCEGEGLKKNQELVCRKLVVENPHLLFRFRMIKAGMVEIDISERKVRIRRPFFFFFFLKWPLFLLYIYICWKNVLY